MVLTTLLTTLSSLALVSAVRDSNSLRLELSRRGSTPSANLPGCGIYEGVTINGVDWFRGVQYAQPPVGGLRFKAPVPPKQRPGVTKATEYASVCAQKDGSGASTGSEDCLYLNVARPSGLSYQKKLPVVIWIHGGGFWNGASYYDGDPTAMLKQSVSLKKEIMFVSIQYRLNAFGFLFHPDVTTPSTANLGLLDQVQALEFIQTHISALGGDPKQVTIWGQSAGATSVEALTLFAPPNLFRAAISNSGYLTSSHPAVFSGLDYAGDREVQGFWALASQAGCGSSGGSAKSAMSCLMSKDTQSLQNAVVGADNTGVAHWAPVIDTRNGSMVSQAPQQVLKNASYNHVPVIIGNTHDDGSYFTSGLGDASALVGWLANYGVDGSAAAKLAALYSKDSSLSGLNFAWTVATDWNFLADRRAMSDALSKTNNTFTYLFTEPGPDDTGSGAHHSADLLFLFGKNDNQGLAGQMQSYWVNFVHDLNPNGGSLPVWPNAKDTKDMQFLAGQTGAISDSFRRAETNLISQLQAAKPSSGSSSSSRHRTRGHKGSPVQRVRSFIATMGSRP